MSGHVKYTPSITTTAAIVGSLVVFANGVPSINFEQPQRSFEIRKAMISGSAFTSYKTIDENSEAYQKVEAIHKFASNLLDNVEDLNPEFSKIIDENYWDLI